MCRVVTGAAIFPSFAWPLPSRALVWPLIDKLANLALNALPCPEAAAVPPRAWSPSPGLCCCTTPPAPLALGFSVVLAATSQYPVHILTAVLCSTVHPPAPASLLLSPGRRGPSAGLENALLPVMLHHVIRTYYPHLWEAHGGEAIAAGVGVAPGGAGAGGAQWPPSDRGQLEALQAMYLDWLAEVRYHGTLGCRKSD